MTDTLNEETSAGDDKIIKEAKRRFKQCETWESTTRTLFLDDIRFANADSDNMYQWPDSIRRNRDIDERPCLTINKTRQHNLQIINDAKQNKPSVKVHPVGNEATYEAAEVFEGVIRHIEYISNAQVAYDTATKFQVEGGIGYWRVVTDYAGDDTFDQEIFIRRIKDPLSVFIDPDINEKDGSDARFAFIFDTVPKEEFNEAYPEYKHLAGKSVLGDAEGWVDDDHVRIAEYYRRVSKADRMMSFTDPTTGEQTVMRASALPEQIAQAVIDDPMTIHREITDDQVEWFLIVGNEIAERKTWAGRYIPVVRVIGEETIIEGRLDRKGHTRNLKDPQRTYNYWTSSAVEQVALQGKMPYVAPVAAIEGYETYWETANRVNYSILPYNHKDSKGNEIPPPKRADQPTMSQGYIEGMQIAQQEMMMVSGQYEANFGQKSNEKSGVAINERQRQGDTATYHFIDNLATGIRFTGKILIDLIPKIYDTPRILRILAEDGTESKILLDPQAQQAYQEHTQQHTQQVQAIFNPNVGKYDVEADVGPAYATKRQEAFNAFSQIISQNGELVGVVGDLMFKNADFPGADEIAERLERMVPPQAKGEGPNPEVQQLQAQLQHMNGLMTTMAQQLAEEKLKSSGKDQLRDIEAYDAITKRISALEKHLVSPKDSAMMLHDLMKEEHRVTLQPVTENNEEQEVAD